MNESYEQHDTVCIVAMEVGGRWPLWNGAVREGVHNVVTVVQQEDQPLGSLVTRVRRALGQASRQGQRVGVLCIACGERTDRRVLVARSQIVKAAFDLMAPAGRVLLTADEAVPEGARQVMTTLAGSLAALAPGHEISVGVSFGAFASGTFPASDPSESTPPAEAAAE